MKLILLLTATVIVSNAFSWSDSGHGAIAMIAYRHLTSAVCTKVDGLLRGGVDDKYHSLAMASYWADDHRGEREETASWHYINIHFRADGKATKNKPAHENVSWAVSKYSMRLGNASLNRKDRAEAFRFLIHFVGDAHQPLHTVARDTGRYPDGDRGGNNFPIIPGNGLPDWNTNLHKVWDSGCGAFELGVRAWERGADEKIDSLSQKIERAYPHSILDDQVKTLSPDAWVNEGFRIAKEFAYRTPEGGTPDTYYVKTGQEICMKRAALAGYRLAAILNKALND